MAQRLLVIAAEFPPVKGIGRLRPLKFCQHLNGMGWQTAVLSPATGDIEPVDSETLKEIPANTVVFRASIPKPKERLVGLVKSIIRHADARGPSSAQEAPLRPGVARATKPARGGVRSLLGGFDRFVRLNLLVPDDIVLWSGPAFRVGIEAVRAFKPDVILATAPHFTNLLIGARLSRATGVPWVADYRDLWTGDVLRAWVPAWRQRLELAMERRILATASAVVTVSEPKSTVMRARLPPGGPCPVVTLTNGYDVEEFEGVEPEGGKVGIFRIVYAGRLFKNRRGYELIQAAGLLLQESPQYRGRLSIEYYGGVAPEIALRMQALVEEFSLSEVVHFFPDVSYQRSKALQKGADALLLIVDSGETSSGVIPGKLFEYIAARRPILCIAVPGATTEIIAKGRLGEAIPPGDVEGLTMALKGMLDRASSPFEPDEEYLMTFERGRIVEQLANLLDEVVSKSRGGSAS